MFIVFVQVLIDLGRFLRTLIKNEFFLKKDFVLVFGNESHFQAVYDFMMFLTAFQFLCCLTILVVCEKV